MSNTMLSVNHRQGQSISGATHWSPSIELKMPPQAAPPAPNIAFVPPRIEIPPPDFTQLIEAIREIQPKITIEIPKAEVVVRQETQNLWAVWIAAAAMSVAALVQIVLSFVSG